VERVKLAKRNRKKGKGEENEVEEEEKNENGEKEEEVNESTLPPTSSKTQTQISHTPPTTPTNQQYIRRRRVEGS
jgi:hypothetical protein